MQNIIGYVETAMDTFAKRGFTAVDSLVLSKLAYVRMDGIVPLPGKRPRPIRLPELLKAEMYNSMFLDMRDRADTLRFLCALAASPRFRNTHLCDYVSNTDPAAEKQFAAVTMLLEDGTAYVAYRGTDATLVGWKEDFNMAYISPVPSQEDAAAYLNGAAKRLPRRMQLRVGGHSKGGNLAVYAAINCDLAVQKRILGAYNHDGPGFKESIFSSLEFARIQERIHTTLPEESLVGMLLQQYDHYLVVESSQHGIMQHDPFTWNIDNDDFVYAGSISNGALIRNKSLNEWLATLSDEKRKRIIDVLFDVLESTKADTFNDLSDGWTKNAVAILSAVKNIDPEVKKFVFSTITELAKISMRNMLKRKGENPERR